ncbi:hypothetical protein OS493_029887 [Desmophyllum pertusum]|uniref:dual-specificity kinase n=1 Tax=Desmophyllum pertusum TaxID=174260 RepID=A0A9X0CEJ6_9CNID|nr:hypothetical protein OS493_029887 [Desmophyllum pertusum]
MVLLMDIPAKGDGDVGRICTDPGSEEVESTRIDRSLLENIPSSIPSSCIYRYQDFRCTKIADGFYGNVYKVRHRETEEVMVLKMNKPDVEKDTCTMLDEIKLMSHLSHQNVIRFLGICVDDSRVHLLCEFVNGGDLEGLLLKHSVHLDWSTRLYLARDIAEGMLYLHKNGVIHRDLTSKNCLIKERSGWRYAIVADLGLATEISEF